MTERSLQVTYRKGLTFAAYLHLSHPTGEREDGGIAGRTPHRRLRGDSSAGRSRDHRSTGRRPLND